MNQVIIFGKSFPIIEAKAQRDLVRVRDNKIVITSCEKPSDLLLKDFLARLLHSQLIKIYSKWVKKEGKVEIFGNLDIEVVEKVDGKRQRIAKLQGNKLLVKLKAVTLPKSALKYLLAHEIAHIFTKRHTRKFWKVVKIIYPDFEEGRRHFEEYGHLLLTTPKLKSSLLPVRE